MADRTPRHEAPPVKILSKKVVWIIGLSATGKQTFINQALDDKDLQINLGWDGQRITASQASISLLAPTPEHADNLKRERIIPEVASRLLADTVALIKWQHVDSNHYRPERLRKLVPDAEHAMLHIHTPPQELAGRLAQKPWWDAPGRELEHIAERGGRLAEQLSKLGSAGFALSTVLSTEGVFLVGDPA